MRKVGNMYQTLCEAIRARAVLRLSMTNGESRIVEPYRYGAKPNGKEFLNAYHRAAAGADQTPRDLKTVAVAEIASAATTGETFAEPRPGYNPAGDHRIPQVFAEL
jgi:hypothetical protein